MTILTAPSPLISGSRPRFKPYVARAGPKVCMTRRWREVDSSFGFRVRCKRGSGGRFRPQPG
jgi:hypothetical protein